MRKTISQNDPAIALMRSAFRDVFLRNDSGTRVLAFLAAFWGFFDRELGTEEKRVQRQCFMDLLIFSGALADDTRDQLLSILLQIPENEGRVMEWIKSWRGVRTRQDEKGIDSETRTK